MKTRPFLNISLAVSALAVTAVFPVSAFARVPQIAPSPATPVTKAKAQVQGVSAKAQRDYIKALPGSGGAIGAAQTAIRRFTPLRGNGPSVYLVAAIHIGEKSYYQQIQQFLDKQSVVLYEGVGPSRSAAKARAVQAARRRASKASPPPVSMYKKFSDALNLQSQTEGIRYNRSHFRNSDLDWDALNALATKAGPETQKLFDELKNTVSGGPTVSESELMLDKVLKFSASTPLVSTLLRRMLVIGLCEPDKIRALLGLKPETGGRSTSAQKLDFIIVKERNKVVLADLKALLQKSKRRAPKPVQSIAIFYGAAHMRDIEQHLVSDLGYRGAELQWITAIGAR